MSISWNVDPDKIPESLSLLNIAWFFIACGIGVVVEPAVVVVIVAPVVIEGIDNEYCDGGGGWSPKLFKVLPLCSFRLIALNFFLTST